MIKKQRLKNILPQLKHAKIFKMDGLKVQFHKEVY